MSDEIQITNPEVMTVTACATPGITVSESVVVTPRFLEAGVTDGIVIQAGSHPISEEV